MATSAERTAHLMDDEEQFQTFLGLIRTGKPFGLACKVCRITRAAMNQYLDTHPARASQYIDAELDANEEIEAILYEEAQGRQKWAITMWLERRDADRWAPSSKDEGSKRLILNPSELKGMLGPAQNGAGSGEE